MNTMTVAIGVFLVSLFASTGAAAQPRESIAVRGHWTLEVRNPDGTIVEQREFDNHLRPEGADFLGLIMLGKVPSFAWTIVLNGFHTPGGAFTSPEGGNSIARIVPPIWQDRQLGTVQFNTLTIAPSLPLTLIGTAIANTNGIIGNVETRVWHCPNNNCPGFPFNTQRDFTFTRLEPPVTLQAEQTVRVTVTISFPNAP
jgi:hypothetical protein